MPHADKNFGGSLVLDFRKWWRHVKTIYRLVVSVTGDHFVMSFCHCLGRMMFLNWAVKCFLWTSILHSSYQVVQDNVSSMSYPRSCACPDKDGKMYNLEPLSSTDKKHPRFAKFAMLVLSRYSRKQTVIWPDMFYIITKSMRTLWFIVPLSS